MTKRYGAVAALQDAELHLRAGEVHVLIGANGSGKSTLCKLVAGSVAPDSGTLLIDGRPVRLSGPSDAADAGVSVFYQELSLVPQLTVAQNIFLGREPANRGFSDEGAMRDGARTLIEPFADVVGRDYGPDRLVAELTPDQRQVTEILKALSQDGRIVLFDEATAALDQRQVKVFFDVIRRLRDEGRAVVFISHRMDEIFAIGDRITVLRDGRTVAALDVADTDRDEVVRAMVGDTPAAETGDAAPRNRAAAGAPLLTAEAFSCGRLRDAEVTVHAGEIVGLGGLHGQGQSALLRGLFGALPARGRILGANGVPLAIGSPRRAMRAGFAYISGDRGRDGLLPTRSVFQNLILAHVNREGTHLVRPGRLRSRLDAIVQRLRTTFAAYGAPVTSLSGGNQQKIVIGRWLAAAPRVLLLDDPTKGVDLQAKADLYRILHDLASDGVAILFHSSDDAELLEISDRVLVFNGGRVVSELTGERLNRFELYKAAYGEAA
ncbi:MAG TPA: sugar ABC transporter ATP-binding protein [Gammaproteobacteria bacterium]|nr:sugar ABC transporter ATP-binding protein [Gammaproteobacteria bacterium]